MADPIPIEVRRLIAGPIESMEHLELLLLLVRTEPLQWSAADAVAELRLESAQAERRLRDLVAAELVIESTDLAGRPRFAFGPVRKSMRTDVQLLLDMYNTKPVTLVRAVYGRRTNVAQSFADAFRIRRDDD